ncbi:hypothetical protein L2E82_10312 [Cichorium intybus]|uniref:Uncharacterized protein n=1 Tax=Cichorium intybus TaxID=13427 RepID=A0ACB9GA80_CICIN|nr:hypothetical protein L2E82_10312 [Cichorium intybus]
MRKETSRTQALNSGSEDDRSIGLVGLKVELKKSSVSEGSCISSKVMSKSPLSKERKSSGYGGYGVVCEEVADGGGESDPGS